ncbi:MAG: hypothetical protein J0I20_04015 [Chloroflexi bacterium]|nr:hypothetical protein [Chloroflexota bacterium]OJW04276.1 MAG: hypothetical protein BGO39_10930 [Chloroflexi bacterium 54-19]
MSNLGDFLPGSKEAKIRAESVTRRRTTAAALTTDLDLELQDLQVSLQLDSKEFSSTDADMVNFKRTLDRAQAIMAQIYADINLIADHPVPERITDQQAYEYVQPAYRIESRANEVRRWLAEASKYRDALGKPREEAADKIEAAENQRLQVESALANSRQVADRLKAAYAENYPQVEAALATASSEVLAASQMVTSARMALGRKSWREAFDLARRSSTLFDSAAAKFQLIQNAAQDYGQAAQDADDALALALRKLNEARSFFNEQARLINSDPAFYLSAVVQRIGEARRAYKGLPPQPPQYVTALRLAREALVLLEQAQDRLTSEVRRLQQSRLDARENLNALNTSVQDLRYTLNAQRSVPLKAKELYEKARQERDKLFPREKEIDQLTLPQLVELAAAAKAALQTARDGLALAG